MRLILLICCALACFCCMKASAQSADTLEQRNSTRRINPKYLNEYGIQRGDTLHAYDSGMLNFQQYQPLRRALTAYQDQGDIGTPYLNLWFNPLINPGFDLGLHPYDAYYVSRLNSRYYFAPVPFTAFYYTQGNAGEKGMINFEALHTQNITKRWNMAANYRSITNEGFYLRQKSSMKNAQLTTHYYTKNQRYHIMGSFNWNKINTQENGGIRHDYYTDSLFRNLDRAIRPVPVNLSNGNNIVRSREHVVKQYLWLAGRYAGNDTAKKQFQPLFGFAHTLSWSKQSAYYTDGQADAAFYDSTYYFNMKGSTDTLALRQLSNRFELIQNSYRTGITHFNAALGHDYILLYQAANKLNYRRLTDYNLYTDASIGIDINKLKIDGTAKLYFAGYNSGDYYGRGGVQLPLQFSNTTLNFKAFAESQLRQPARLQTDMLSNHYIWDQGFDKTLANRIGFEFSGRSETRARRNGVHPEWLNLSGTLSTITNLQYFDAAAKPQQYTKTLTVTSICATKNFDLKNVQFNTTLLYQLLSQEAKAYIRIPELVVKSQLYYQKRIFKNVMFMQLGADVTYNTQYYAQEYNPATHQFQMQDKVRTGNYPYIDLFFNGEVKTLRFFFKLEHFNQDMLGRSAFPNYFYASPYAPSAPRRLRIGLAWRFYS